MKIHLAVFAITLLSASVSFAEEGKCQVISKGALLDQFEFYSTFSGAPHLYPITQNDGSILNYSVSVNAQNGELKISISNRDKTVSAGNWIATDLIAEGRTVMKLGSKLAIDSGFTSPSLLPLISVVCEVTKR